MIQLLTVLPCTRALTGPNGFHIKGGSFVRNIYEPVRRRLEFVVCLRVENEPPPDVQIEVLDPWTSDLYHGTNTGELEQVSPIHQVRVTIDDVILQETGEYVFRVIVNGDAVFAGPLWGYLK